MHLRGDSSSAFVPRPIPIKPQSRPSATTTSSQLPPKHNGPSPATFHLVHPNQIKQGNIRQESLIGDKQSEWQDGHDNSFSSDISEIYNLDLHSTNISRGNKYR